MIKEIMIVNPSLRPSKRKTGAKKMKRLRKAVRTARQKAATRKLVALNRKRARGPVKRRRRARSVAAPKRRRARSVAAAPARRRARRSYAAAPVRRRARRRNPIRLTPKSIMDQLVMPSMIQAGGAIGLDILMGYANPMLPDAMKTGYAAILTKGLGAIVLGMGVDMFWKRNKVGTHLAVGGVTVALHDMGKQMLGEMAPNIPLGEVDYNALGAWGSIDGGIGAYVSDSGDMNAGMNMGAYTSGDPWLDTANQTAAQGVAMQFDDGMGAYV